MSEHKPNVDPHEATHAESIRPGKLIAGAPIGGYHLETVLGEGGMGVVWSARDPLLDRTIAIKVLKSREANAAMRTRLLREAQAMARLKHPNVLPVFQVGTDGDRDFIVMELVDGGPMDHWLAFGPPFEEIVTALLAAGRGLAAAHAAGLVHRDFKPNNVLRSKDGRVLVTDFGLARGLGDDWQSSSVTSSGSELPVASAVSVDMSAAPNSNSSRNNVLDSPLTRTGAMLGTPAYMAPEQFAGGEPDPRTDQFAFCVTAWQALTGARPFHGRTIDELRQAAGGGVASIVAELSKPIRAVLTRGLDPDPAKRWPDLETLLRAFEAAAKPRRKLWPLLAGGALVAIAIAIVVLTRGGAAPTCAPADTAWGEAWSIAKQKHVPDGAKWIGNILADHHRRWAATYEQTCKSERGTRIDARIACLRAVRDRIALVGDLARSGGATLDPYLFLVPPETCAGKPYAIPVLADDDRRARVLPVLVRAVAEPRDDKLIDEAEAVGWAPLVPIVTISIGRAHMKHGDIARARDHLERALALAETSDPRTVAIARLQMLAASTIELARPEELPTSKREAMHEEVVRLTTHARSAIRTVNDEPVLAGILAFLDAEAIMDHAERAPRKATLDNALARVKEARAAFETAGDLRRGAHAAALYAEIQLRRGDANVLGDAETVARSAAALLESAKLPSIPALDSVLARILFARNDIVNAHVLVDRGAPAPSSITGDLVDGIVLDHEGKPTLNAAVVAWSGDLHGDAVRAVTDRRTLRGEIVETSADGKFKVHLREGAAIVAERGGYRSVPMVIARGAKLVLQLAPTTELTGKVDARESAGIEAFVRYQVGTNAWFVHAPILGDAFRITGLPRTSVAVGLSARSGTGTRRVTLGVANLGTEIATARRFAWPANPASDVIARGTLDATATVWVTSAAANGIPTRRELELFMSSALDVSTSTLIPIGSRTTDAGRQKYAAGDRHAVLFGDLREQWACVAPSAAPDAKIACKQLDESGVVVIELP